MTSISPTQQKADEQKKEKLAAMEAQIRAGNLVVRKATRKELAALKAARERKAQYGTRSVSAAA